MLAKKPLALVGDIKRPVSGDCFLFPFAYYLKQSACSKERPCVSLLANEKKGPSKIFVTGDRTHQENSPDTVSPHFPPGV